MKANSVMTLTKTTNYVDHANCTIIGNGFGLNGCETHLMIEWKMLNLCQLKLHITQAFYCGPAQLDREHCSSWCWGNAFAILSPGRIVQAKQ